MSKADDETTTRRVILAAAGAAVGMPLMIVAAKATAQTSCIVEEVRSLAVRTFRAVCADVIAADVHGEHSPEHLAVRAVRERLDSEFEALAERVYRSPVKSFDDIVARAEVASFYGDRDDNGDIKFLDPDAGDPELRANAQLLKAVLELAGGDAVGRLRYADELTLYKPPFGPQGGAHV